MEYVLVPLVTLLGAALTLFSGFGLGTLLMPVFAIFFPVELAIAMTAIVHFLNNLIKLGFYFRQVDRNIVFRFGIPSVIAAFAGAWLLNLLSGIKPLTSYTIGQHLFEITPVKLTIALLLVIFSLMDIIPKLSSLQFDRKYMPFGGLLSGFFGGLSGNQGALRTAFLIRAGLSKEVFIGTGVMIACLVDITRLSIYSGSIFHQLDSSQALLLVLASCSAFAGVYFGNKLVKKITIGSLQFIVAVMLLIFSLLLGAGVI
ncbi:MAG: sulfite exporter TauE/SafE family protein [Bacteroidales bacterium]